MSFEEFFGISLPNDWDVVTIDEIKADVPNAVAMGPFGSRINTKNFVESGVPVIRGVNLSEGRFKEEGFVYITDEKADELKSSNAKRLDIVITHRGTLGQVGIIPEDSQYDRYVVSQSQMKLTCDISKSDPHYVYYFFKSKFGQESLLKAVSQTGVPAIARPLTTLKNIEIPLPCLEEQKRIAKILLSLDKKIELNNRINKTLEEIAQAIFKSWFVDFEPFRDGEFVESELGMIPKGWRTQNILEFAHLFSGGTPKTSVPEFWDGPIPWLAAKDVTANQGRFALTTERTITELGVEKSNAKILPKNTMVITARGTVGAYCLLGKKMAINQSTYGLKARKEEGDYYLYFTIANHINLLKQHSYGTVFDTITTKTFKSMDIIVPPDYVLEAFHRTVKPLMEKLLSNQRENISLSTLRDTLLPKLMSGEIRVPLD